MVDDEAGESARYAAVRAAATPDTGERLTDHGLWDEAARPTAPPPLPGQRYSEQGQAVAALLVDVHGMLRAELRQLRDLLVAVVRGQASAADARGAINALTMRQHDWSIEGYCAQFCRVVTAHHSIENAWVFPHLRRSDGGLGPVVDRLEAEHLVIHEVIQRTDRALASFLGDESRIGDLHVAVDVLTDTLLSHLAYEEQQLLEPLARFGFGAPVGS